MLLRHIVPLATVLALSLLAACYAPAPAKKELTAQEIVDKSTERMQALKSLHFRLEVVDGKMALGPGIVVDNLEGDAINPDRIRVTTKTTFAGIAIDIEFISVEGKQYLRNPLTNRWEPLPVAVAPINLFDREKGAAGIMQRAKNLTKLPNETIDGTESYHIRGTVESSDVAPIFGAAPSGSEVQADVWIGTSDFLIRQIRLEGPLVQGDAPNVVRMLKLSKFDEPVSIEPPV